MIQLTKIEVMKVYGVQKLNGYIVEKQEVINKYLADNRITIARGIFDLSNQARFDKLMKSKGVTI